MNLIRIELRKMKMGWYIRGALIANVIIMGFMWLISYSEKADGGVSFQSTDEAFLIIGTFVRAVFIVFGAVLIVKLVISEYKNKTILVMFTYPISRKKLLTAKLMIAGGLTFITILLSLLAKLDLPFHTGRAYFRDHFSTGGQNGGFRFWRRWNEFSSHLFWDA